MMAGERLGERGGREERETQQRTPANARASRGRACPHGLEKRLALLRRVGPNRLEARAEDLRLGSELGSELEPELGSELGSDRVRIRARVRVRPARKTSPMACAFSASFSSLSTSREAMATLSRQGVSSDFVVN